MTVSGSIEITAMWDNRSAPGGTDHLIATVVDAMVETRHDWLNHPCDDWAPRAGHTCTMVRTSDGARCELNPNHAWPHRTRDGEVFPTPQREFRGREMRVA